MDATADRNLSARRYLLPAPQSGSGDAHCNSLTPETFRRSAGVWPGTGRRVTTGEVHDTNFLVDFQGFSYPMCLKFDRFLTIACSWMWICAAGAENVITYGSGRFHGRSSAKATFMAVRYPVGKRVQSTAQFRCSDGSHSVAESDREDQEDSCQKHSRLHHLKMSGRSG